MCSNFKIIGENVIMSEYKIYDKVRIINVDNTSNLYNLTGIYAGSATSDGYIGIVLLDNRLEDSLAITIPHVCLQKI